MTENTKDPVIEEFLYQLRRRLYAGKIEYGDRSFERPTSHIVRERAEEALDGAGWSFVLWRKFREQTPPSTPVGREWINCTDAIDATRRALVNVESGVTINGETYLTRAMAMEAARTALTKLTEDKNDG